MARNALPQIIHDSDNITGDNYKYSMDDVYNLDETWMQYWPSYLEKPKGSGEFA